MTDNIVPFKKPHIPRSSTSLETCSLSTATHYELHVKQNGCEEVQVAVYPTLLEAEEAVNEFAYWVLGNVDFEGALLDALASHDAWARIYEVKNGTRTWFLSTSLGE